MSKILIIHNKYRDLGGEDLAVDNEVSFLRKDNEVETIFFDNKKVNVFGNLISFITGSNPKSIKELDKIYENFNPDIVYIHNTWFNASIGVFNYFEQKNVKILLKLHNFRYYCTRYGTSRKHFLDKDFCNACGLSKKEMGYFNKYFNDSYIKSILIFAYGRRYFKIIKKSKLELIVLTKFHKSFLSKLGIPESKITVIPNVLDFNYLKSVETESNDIIYAGRISEEKGIQELVEAFIDAGLSDINLKIIGEGPLLKYLQRNYKHKNIVFTGIVPNKETHKLIGSSLCVVTATKLFEGQPTLLTEAALMGIPAIFPNSEGIKEFFPQNTKLAFKQFDYKDLTKKIKLVNNKKLLHSEGSGNQEYINNKLDETIINEQFQNLFSRKIST